MAAFDERYEDEIDDFEEDEDTQKEKYIAFLLGDEEYAIEIQYVIEIVGMQKFTHIPEAANYVKGVIKLRENVYPVIDMRKRFKLNESDYTDRTCIIIVKINENSIGLIVDSVNEVINIPEANISQSASAGLSSKSQFIRGIGKLGDRVVIILDINKVLSDADLAEINI